MIVCPATTSGVYGINLTGRLHNLSCVNNTIESGNIGIRIATSGEVVSNWRVDENSIRSSTNGIQSNNDAVYINDISISRNTITATTADAILVGEMRRLRIHDNVIDAASGDHICTQGADEILDFSIRHQRRIQTTDATLTSALVLDMADNTAVHARSRVLAMESDGSDRAIYDISGLFYRDGGGTTQQGSSSQKSNTLNQTLSAYTVSNLSTDRAYDANSTTTAELADVLGTLIADLTAKTHVSDATWPGATFQTSSNTLLYRIQGKASETINWVVDIEMESVS